MASDGSATGKPEGIDAQIFLESIASTWSLGFVALATLACALSLIAPAALVAPAAVILAGCYSAFLTVRHKAANRLTDHSRMSMGQILERQVHNGRRISIQDPSTGVMQKWYFELRVAEEVDRCKRFGEPMALLRITAPVLPISRDAWGSDAEWHMAQDVSRQLRAIDISTRVATLELIVCLPHTDTTGAQVVARRLFQDLARWTLSFSVATYPIDGEDADTLLQTALNREPSEYLEPPGLVDFPVKQDYREIIGRLGPEDVAEVPLVAGETTKQVKQRLRRASRARGVSVTIWEREGRVFCALAENRARHSKAA